MPDFKLVAPFEPTGDQPAAIERLTDGLAKGVRHQTLLGATGTGKTVDARLDDRRAPTSRRSSSPTTRRSPPSCTPSSASSSRTTRSSTSSATSTTTSPRRTCPRSDTYIEKDSSRNDEIDRLRHAATHALFERRDVIIVASVSLHLRPRRARSTTARRSSACATGGQYRRDAVLRHLVDLQYQRNDQALTAGPVPRPRRHARAPAGVGRDRSSASSSSATRSSGSPRSTR